MSENNRPFIQRFITRRAALKQGGVAASAALLAAAVTLSPAVAAPVEEISKGTGIPMQRVHMPGCFHEIWSQRVDRSDYSKLLHDFEATLTEEQREMFLDLSDADNDINGQETDLFIDSLCMHLPGLAPTINMLAYHHIQGAPLSQWLTCCAE